MTAPENFNGSIRAPKAGARGRELGLQSLLTIAGAALLAALAGPGLALGAEAVLELEARVTAAAPSGGELVVQPMAGFGPGWGADAQIFWRPASVGNTLSVPLEAPAAGTYDVVLFYTVAPDYGDFSVRLGDGASTGVSGYEPAVALRSIPLGRHAINSNAKLHFKVEGKDGKSTGFVLGLDRLVLLPAAAPAPPAATRVASPGLRRLTTAAPASARRDEFLVVDGAKARLGRVANDRSLTLAPPRDLPEGLHWVGNFDHAAGDEVLTWDPVSGDHFLTRFSAGGEMTHERVGRSFEFDAEIFRTVGRFAEPGVSCLFAWRERRSFGVRRLVDGACFSATALLTVEGVAVAADVTGNGRDEAVFITPDGSLDVMILGAPYSQEGLDFDLLEYSQERAADRWSPGLEIAIANVDGDPAQEILAMVRSNGEVWRLDFNAAGRVERRTRVASGWPAERALRWALDTDGDGRDELVVVAPGSREIWLAKIGESALELTSVTAVRPSFVYPGRFLGGSRQSLVLQEVEAGQGGRLGVLAWAEEGPGAVLDNNPAHQIPEFATVLVGDFLPE